MKLENRIAIVTGGTKGIGKAILLKLAEDGAKVYAFSRNIPEDKSSFCDNAELMSQVSFIKTDISDANSINDSVSQVVKAEGRIDILVNNAGITKDNLLIRMTEEDFSEVIDINLKGTFLSIKAVARTMMSQRSGKIINIGSIVGTIGNAGQCNYAASKAGMIGLTKSIAKELAGRNILVNLIAPGYVNTDMTNKLSDTIKNFFLNNIPLKRAAETKEIANVVSFFASDDSNYITGQVIHVDGGLAI